MGDTSLSFTTDATTTIATMVQELTHIATYWNRLLHYSGGSLNLQKCAYHLTMWEWKHGRPMVRHPKQLDPQVFIQSLSNDKAEQIRYQRYDQPSRILGVHVSPAGDFTHQLSILKQKADTYSTRLLSPQITPDDAMLFLRTTYIPAMGYCSSVYSSRRRRTSICTVLISLNAYAEGRPFQ